MLVAIVDQVVLMVDEVLVEEGGQIWRTPFPRLPTSPVGVLVYKVEPGCLCLTLLPLLGI